MELKTINEILEMIKKDTNKDYILIKTEEIEENILCSFVESKFVRIEDLGNGQKGVRFLKDGKIISKTSLFMVLCWSNNLERSKVFNNQNIFIKTEPKLKNQIDNDIDLFEIIQDWNNSND